MDAERRGARPEYVRRAAEDTPGALDELVRAGKVREIGCSAAARDGAARFVSVQNQYSILHRDGAPLPEGSRAQAGFGLVESLVRFAISRGHTLLELAFSWLAARPAVASVTAGATTPQKVRANACAAVWQLTDADLTAVDAIVSQPGERSAP